jgi:DNA modification methylase
MRSDVLESFKVKPYVPVKLDKAKYFEFLENKVAFDSSCGFHVDPSEVNPILLPHQRDSVIWAVRQGRVGLFASFGLGKSVMQLEWVRLTLKHTLGAGLIVAPLNVVGEFKRDAAMLGITITFIQKDSQAIFTDGAIYITNYESVREGKLDPSQFSAVSLDEATILSSFGGTKTFREFMRYFEYSGKHRMVATATPSPNQYIELLAYAGFLEVGDVGQMKTRFFKRDSTKADNLTLHPHKEDEFWLWCSTWGIFISKPSDLGYSDQGYELPPLDVRWHMVNSDHTYAQERYDHFGQSQLLEVKSLGVQGASKEKRDSLQARIAKVLEIRAEDPAGHRIIWHDLESERVALEKAIPSIKSVYGSQSLDVRYPLIVGFGNGEFPELAAKPMMLGCGCNFQRHCHHAIFMGIGFKFRDIIQAIHRIQRFQQTQPVRIDFIYTEAEVGIRAELERKWEQHKVLSARMSALIQEFGLNPNAKRALMQRNMGVARREEMGDRWKVVNNDSVIEASEMDADSVGLILTSIPFGNQYEYSANYADLGHTDSTTHFWEQMGFLIPQLLRVLQPGRDCVVHVKDRIIHGGMTGLGYQTLDPFHAEAIFEFKRHGFTFLGMHTVATDVVRENNQTYRLGWTEQCKDGSRMGCGVPEYVLLFRKPQTDRSKGYADVPVVKDKETYERARWQLDASGFWLSQGDRLMSSSELMMMKKSDVWKIWKAKCLAGGYNYEEHVQICMALEEAGMLPTTFALVPCHTYHPDVWTDVMRARTMNMIAVQQNKVSHICPLQFDICDRIIRQRSNEGDVVYDPFSGVGTVPLRARALGRIGWGSELSPTYFDDSVKYLRQQECKVPTLSLFDVIDCEIESDETEGIDLPEEEAEYDASDMDGIL